MSGLRGTTGGSSSHPNDQHHSFRPQTQAIGRDYSTVPMPREASKHLVTIAGFTPYYIHSSCHRLSVRSRVQFPFDETCYSVHSRVIIIASWRRLLLLANCARCLAPVLPYFSTAWRPNAQRPTAAPAISLRQGCLLLFSLHVHA